MNAPESTPRARPSRGETSAGPAAFVAGLRYPWRGLAFLIARPALWPWAVTPVVLCVALYVACIWTGWHFVGGWLGDALLEPGDGFWHKAAGYTLAVIFWIVILVVAAVVYVPLASLIASPFNDFLSEKTERLYQGHQIEEAFSWRLVWRAIRVGLLGEIQRTLVVTALLVAALALNFVPLIGQVLAPAASMFITIRYLSLEFTSFSMDRRLYTWPAKREFLRQFRARTLGFGSMSFLIMLVPLVNATFIPISAIAGTLLFCDAAAHDAERGAK